MLHWHAAVRLHNERRAQRTEEFAMAQSRPEGLGKWLNLLRINR